MTYCPICKEKIHKTEKIYKLWYFYCYCIDSIINHSFSKLNAFLYILLISWTSETASLTSYDGLAKAIIAYAISPSSSLAFLDNKWSSSKQGTYSSITLFIWSDIFPWSSPCYRFIGLLERLLNYLLLFFMEARNFYFVYQILTALRWIRLI